MTLDEIIKRPRRPVRDPVHTFARLVRGWFTFSFDPVVLHYGGKTSLVAPPVTLTSPLGRNLT